MNHCCTPETNTTLKINHTSKKLKKQKQQGPGTVDQTLGLFSGTLPFLIYFSPKLSEMEKLRFKDVQGFAQMYTVNK